MPNNMSVHPVLLPGQGLVKVCMLCNVVCALGQSLSGVITLWQVVVLAVILGPVTHQWTGVQDGVEGCSYVI